MTRPLKTERAYNGYLLMTLATVFFALVHAGVKLIPRIPVHEIVVARGLLSSLLTWLALKKRRENPWGNNRLLLTFRGVAGTAALVLYFYTLQVMPLATAVTIQYLHPILTVILAAFFLKESATKNQWLCFAGSFVGVLMVKGFDPRVNLLDLGLGVAGALASAVAYNLIRFLRDQDSTLVVMFYLPLMNLILIAPWTAFHFITPTWFEAGVMIFIGAMTQIAQYLMTESYKKESAANISNLNYLGVLYAALIGTFLFDDHIEGLAIIGMSVIVASAMVSVRVGKNTIASN